MDTFEKIITARGKKYFNRFYPLLLEDNLFLRSKYSAILNKVLAADSGYILDLGCGTGIYLPLLSNYGRAVFGVDKSYILAREAKTVLGERKATMLAVAEAENPPFHKEVFDFVFVNDSLIHFDRQEEVLMQIKGILKDGGKVCFVEPNVFNPLMMLTLVFFKNGRRIFARNIINIQKKIKRHFIIEETRPFNLIYTKDKWKISLINLFDKITSFSGLSFFSLRYAIVARKAYGRD